MSKHLFTDESRLNDPMFWFMKANYYYSATKLILSEIRVIRSGVNIGMKFNAINATPYLSAVSAELFMKGYLISKGIPPKQLRSRGHNISSLRKKCLSYGDIRFNNPDLLFLTDQLGEQIMEDGGIRYPHKKDIPVYLSVFRKALDILATITGEIPEKNH